MTFNNSATGSWGGFMESLGVFFVKAVVFGLALQFIIVGLVFLFWILVEGYHGAVNLMWWTRRKMIDCGWGLIHRTTKKYHVVKLRSLTPGYHDTDTRILHSMMDLIVDHVEISLSMAHFDESSPKLTRKERLWCSLPWFLKPNEWLRSRERGLEYLKWEKTLDDLSIPLKDRQLEQAQAAKVIEEVYIWWKDVRPQRKSVEDLVDWNSYVQKRVEIAGEDGYFAVRDIPEALMKEEGDMIKRAIQIEKDYLAEDQKMMKKVVDILPYIWI